MRAIDKFLPDEANRRLFPGFIAFCLAAVGVTLVFIAQAIDSLWISPWLALLGVIMALLGILGGFICIIYGYWSMLRSFWLSRRKKSVDSTSNKSQERTE